MVNRTGFQCDAQFGDEKWINTADWYEVEWCGYFYGLGSKKPAGYLGSGVSTGSWHHLLVSYDENASDDYELKVYLDGALSGISSELGGRLQVKPNDQWMLGAPSMTDPINGRFTGILDDMRFYCSNNSEQLALETYNRGNGDLSLSVDAVFPANIHDNPISASLTFKKYGIEYDVSDLNDSRITIDNGQLLSYSGSNANWTIDFNSSVDPGRVTVSLLEGVGIDNTGEESKPMSFTVGSPDRSPAWKLSLHGGLSTRIMEPR